MDSPFLKELSDLLCETEKMLADPEPESAAWEDYGRMREETFRLLKTEDPSKTEDSGERARLRELIEAILERDRLLMQRLERYLAGCRKELSAVPKTHQALRGYFPPRPGSLQRQA
jgi:hypothetical protein